MAFTPIEGLCTGFEMGYIPVSSSLINGDVTASTAEKKTGSYSMKVIDSSAYGSSIKWTVPGTVSDIYVGVWMMQGSSQSGTNLQFMLSDNNYYQVSRMSSSAYLLIRDMYGNTLATGTHPYSQGSWHHIQVHFVSADSGTIEIYLDGVLDVTYSGDTKPGSSTTISYVIMHQTGYNYYAYWDNLAIGTGGYPGDIRFDVMTPTSDVTEEWDNQTGTDAYAMVDEIPPSTTDYFYTTVDAETNLLGLSDWDGTSKSPAWVTTWMRASKDEAAGHQITMVQNEGASSHEDTKDLQTTYEYYAQLETTAPDGTAWDDTHIDALRAGVISNIV